MGLFSLTIHITPQLVKKTVDIQIIYSIYYTKVHETAFLNLGQRLL